MKYDKKINNNIGHQLIKNYHNYIPFKASNIVNFGDVTGRNIYLKATLSKPFKMKYEVTFDDLDVSIRYTKVR
jgi:hypothetical protein